MDYSELLPYQTYIYLNSLFEPEDNALILDIDRCMINGIPVGDNSNFSSYGAIEVDETLPILRLEFDWYIAYSVTNESFSVMDDSEVFEGKVFSIYSKSYYLDFIKNNTIADDMHPGPFKHYGINALNHVINVISTEPPNVSLIPRNGHQE